MQIDFFFDMQKGSTFFNFAQVRLTRKYPCIDFNGITRIINKFKSKRKSEHRNERISVAIWLFVFYQISFIHFQLVDPSLSFFKSLVRESTLLHSYCWCFINLIRNSTANTAHVKPRLYFSHDQVKNQ